MVEKRCSRCEQTQSPDAFYRTPTGKRQSWCKTCCREKAREYYHDHREEILHKQRTEGLTPSQHAQIQHWKATNTAHISAYNAHYYQTVTKPKRQRIRKGIA